MSLRIKNCVWETVCGHLLRSKGMAAIARPFEHAQKGATRNIPCILSGRWVLFGGCYFVTQDLNIFQSLLLGQNLLVQRQGLIPPAQQHQ